MPILAAALVVALAVNAYRHRQTLTDVGILDSRHKSGNIAIVCRKSRTRAELDNRWQARSIRGKKRAIGIEPT